jgi:hypothetical protein
MSADSQDVHVFNLEPRSDPHAYARAGYLFIASGTVSIAGSGTALFNLATGADGLQIEGYELASTEQDVYAELVEGATVTTTGAAVPSYNLNRNSDDDAEAVLTAASTVTGGSAISAELITASKIGGGGMGRFTKIHTLEASSDYAFRFTNLSEQVTLFFFQIIFSEKFNGQNDVWVGGEPGNGYRLPGGHHIHLPMVMGQTLSASAVNDSRVSILRQD